MNTVSKIFAAALAFTIAALPAAGANAQGYPSRHEVQRPHAPQPPRAPQPPKLAPHPHKPGPQFKPAPQPHAHKPMPARRKFSRGDRFQDWRRYAEVRDYKRHGLRPPAPGPRWIKVDNDYVLIGIATGVIASIIAGR